jgi:D-threonate/D-erythronate kinase
MADNRILVLADDLTGALEVGAKFAASGVASQARIAPAFQPRDLQDAAGALVVDTETRHAAASKAARRVYEFADAAYREGFSHVYKKTDSTLRGNIGAELAALCEAFAGAPLLYVPAYPQMGRSVRSGTLHVNGVQVGATSFAGDPFNPVTESHIPTLLRSQCRLPIHSVSVADIAVPENGGIVICDGETDTDVEFAARAFASSSSFRSAAGPAAFAAHLARLVDLPRGRPAALPGIRTALVVNGSLHNVSRQQVEQAKREGFKSIESDSIPALGADGDWTIMETGTGPGGATLDFAQTMARSVCHFLSHAPIDALVIFGGDTANAVVQAIGSPPIYPIGEVMEGVPISRVEANRLSPYIGHREHDLYLVTKAGGFGAPNILTAIRNLLGKR